MCNEECQRNLEMSGFAEALSTSPQPSQQLQVLSWAGAVDPVGNARAFAVASETM